MQCVLTHRLCSTLTVLAWEGRSHVVCSSPHKPLEWLRLWLVTNVTNRIVGVCPYSHSTNLSVPCTGCNSAQQYLYGCCTSCGTHLIADGLRLIPWPLSGLCPLSVSMRPSVFHSCTTNTLVWWAELHRGPVDPSVAFL